MEDDRTVFDDINGISHIFAAVDLALRERFCDFTIATETHRVTHRSYHLYYPVRFAVCELGYLLLSILALLPILGFRWKRKILTEKRSLDSRIFLFYCMAVPFLMHILIAGLFKMKLNGEYGAAFWPFFGVFLLLCFESKTEKKNVFASSVLIGTFESFMIIVLVIQAIVSPHFLGTTRVVHLPMYRLGAECERIWNMHTDLPCPYITGDWLLAGSAAYVMKDRPSVHFYYDRIDDIAVIPSGTWSEDSDVNKKGGLIIWRYAEELQPKREKSYLGVPDYIAKRSPERRST